jgi:uncharacterized membrane protein YoaK (UPF0700 family)
MGDEAYAESRRRVTRYRVVIWLAAAGLLVDFAIVGAIRGAWLAIPIFGAFAAGMVLTAFKTSRSGLPHTFMTALLTRHSDDEGGSGRS